MSDEEALERFKLLADSIPTIEARNQQLGALEWLVKDYARLREQLDSLTEQRELLEYPCNCEYCQRDWVGELAKAQAYAAACERTAAENQRENVALKTELARLLHGEPTP